MFPGNADINVLVEAFCMVSDVEVCGEEEDCDGAFIPLNRG